MKYNTKIGKIDFDKLRKKYISNININSRLKHLGYFNTIKEASNAYQTKLKSLLNQ